ncbi:uncharacterized protein LOC129282859 isoform X2 [Lytechinus pictus]|uniref:uncharacterized protein LOC129282859 isoform X2 n=1 Tax=Lytechinus pictus TaxID=7653 RepID=UPI0030B9FEBF
MCSIAPCIACACCVNGRSTLLGKACLNMSSSDSTRGKSASEKEDKSETSACMPVYERCCCSNSTQDKMPKSRKRKRSRGRHHSSSSQSSSERLGRGSRRAFIAITHKKQSSAQEMATVLASELKPEHKLPKKEIWVSPIPQFLKLLRTVGAQGNTFTAKEVLSYLIKYISSRQLYDPNDPKNVFCKSDPLGQVFKVHSFTIKDAKRLLFENMKVLDKPPEMPTIPRRQSLPETRKDYYITFRNNQEHTHEMAPAPPYPLPHLYTHPAPRSAYQSGVKVISSGVDVADGIDKDFFDQQVMEKMLDTVSEGREGGTDEPDVGISVTPPPQTCLSSRRKSRSRSESSSLTLASRASHRSSQRSSHRSSQRSSHRSSHRSSQRSSHRSSQRSSSKRSSLKSATKRSTVKRSRGDVADGRGREGRPWYCVFYNAEEDVKSQSSEIYSVQGKETAVVTDTSDDLWFMDDDRFSVEYEVEDSESEPESNDARSDSTTTEAEIFVEVDDLGSSSDSRFADEDTTDSEIPEEDKWKCSECNQVNNPVHGYCSFCWARRSGWLADEDRKNPTERLGDKHVLRRAFSAPAGCHQDEIRQSSVPARVLSQADNAPCGSDEAGIGHRTASPLRFQSIPRDFADGKSGDEGEEHSRSHVQEERHVFCQISSPGLAPPLRPLQGFHGQDGKAPLTHLTTVHEASEEAIPLNINRRAPASCTLTPHSSTTHGNEDQGVGSDVSQNTQGVADTVSHHSSDSSGDAAGCTPRKRRALLVSREDSGVCLKRQSSGHSGADSIRPVVKSTLPVSTNLIQATPIITTGCSHEKMITKVGGQTSGSSPLAGPSIATHPMHHIPVMTSLTEKTSVGPHQTMTLQSPRLESPGLTSSTTLPLPIVGSSTMGSGAVASHAQELCRFCCVRPKTACIIHGRTGHQVCCYKCAKKLRRRGKPCPVCRRPIQHIVKNFYA